MKTGQESGPLWRPALAFVLLLPVSFFLGVTFVIGHARLLPYVSAWQDRILFSAVLFGLPGLAAALTRLLPRRRQGPPEER